MTAIIPLLIMSVLAGVAIAAFIWHQIRSESSNPAKGAGDPNQGAHKRSTPTRRECELQADGRWLPEAEAGVTALK